MDNFNTPFLDKIKELSEQNPRFFVPGHKGNPQAIPFFEGILPFDLTEITGADNLQNPEDTLLQSQKNMAQVYGAGATLYSAGGSTSCIQAMLALYLHEGDMVVMARNCHVSAVRALAFLNAKPVWVYPENGVITAEKAEEALQTSGAKVLYITSPDYYGNIADVQALSTVCRKYNAKLLVDNAHGAHLVLFGKHPLALGADAVAESLHKTLPALTPAAQLHLKNKEDAPYSKQMLNLFTSTSPAYPVLCSIDWCAGLLQEHTQINAAYQTAAEAVQGIYQANQHLCLPLQDPCKLTLAPQKAGYTAEEVLQILQNNGIEPELATAEYIVLMATGYNTSADFDSLQKVLQKFPPKKERITPQKGIKELSFPVQGCSIRKALFSEKHTLSTSEAAGKIAAQIVAPCPPGIPVLIPGEKISNQTAKNLLESGIFTVEVLL